MRAEQPYTLTRFIGELANTVAGLLVWATHFAVVYSVHAVACARGLNQWSVLGLGLVPFTIAVATALALAGSGVVLAIALRDLRRMHHQHSDVEDSQRFLTYTSATVAGFSILAIVWVALPVLFIEPCTL
jgi:hypothetical protein